MSQPKRYFLKISQTISGLRADVYESENGEYVLYSDYAALQAEAVKQIEAALPPVEAYIAKLEAENERLRKAGDVMAIMLQHDEVSNAWLAAKGVQS